MIANNLTVKWINCLTIIQLILNNLISQITDYNLTELIYKFKIREKFDLIISDIPQIYKNITEIRSIIK
jgi:UDP-N-acetylglucosamine transferase subunit ALG13